jgi:hypothetical protein
MAHRIRLALCIGLIILLLLGSNLVLAQKSVNPTSPNPEPAWVGQYIHHVNYPNNVGDYVSLAINPIDNRPHVSYYDATNGDLMYALYVGKGLGNCGTGNNWHCEALDTTGNVGTSTSIDIWQVDSDSYKVGISYHDVTNGALKYISWICHPLNCTIKNDVTISASDFAWLSIGDFTSLKLDPNGNPHIAYYRSNTIGDDSLMIGNYVGSGGNCGEGTSAGKWQCDMIDIGNGVGQYVSLDLTYDGSPYLAYYDAGFGNLKVAYYLGIADPDCDDENGWVCPVVDSVGNVGKYVSITAQHQIGDQIFRIAYYDATNQQLKYYDPTWNAVVVDEMGTSLSPMGIAMDIDSNGYPIIAYQQISSDFSPPQLLIARPYLVYNDGNFGNCGDTPPGYIFLYWRCNILDYAGQYLEEASYVSVDSSAAGPQIAYSEFYSYDVGDNAMSLKYLSQMYQLFMPVLVK